MGLRERIKGKKVYFDTNIFIYILEGYEELKEQIDGITISLSQGEIEVFTSELTLCEILVHPFRKGNKDSIGQYRSFLEESGAFQLVPTSRETYVRASECRAFFSLKTPDAIHVATALESGCDIFLTNDRDIHIPDLPIEVLPIG